jgi:hypothetical protein
MQQAVTDVNVISEKNRAVLDKMDKISRLHDNRLDTIQQGVRELLILTQDSGESKRLMRTMAQQISDLNSHMSVSANLQQDQASSSSVPSIHTTSYQGSGSMTFDAFCSCKTQRTRYSQHRWGPFVLEAEIKSRDHHAPECPMSKLPAATGQTKRVLNFSVPAI